MRHRLANSAEHSIEQKQIQEELAQTLKDRAIIHEHIQQIVVLSLSDHRLEEVTQSRMKLTQYGCYKSVTQYIHEKCYDLQVRRLL